MTQTATVLFLLTAIIAGLAIWTVRLAFSQHDLNSKRRELDRREADIARRKAIAEELTDSVVTIDQVGAILEISPGTCKMFGYSHSELIGRNVNLLMPEPFRSEHDGYLSCYRKTGQAHIIGTAGRELVAKKKDGTEFPILLSISQVVLPEGGHVFVGTIKDVTLRRWAELSKLAPETRKS